MQRMTGFKGRCSRSVFALASLVLLLASPTDQAIAQHKIIEGFVSHGALQWPEYIATEFGWFKEHGLEVDMLVVGADQTLQFDEAFFARRMSDPLIAMSLRRSAITPAMLMRKYIGNEGMVKVLSESIPLNVDDHPVLEFSAPRSLFINDAERIAKELAILQRIATLNGL